MVSPLEHDLQMVAFPHAACLPEGKYRNSDWMFTYRGDCFSHNHFGSSQQNYISQEYPNPNISRVNIRWTMIIGIIHPKISMDYQILIQLLGWRIPIITIQLSYLLLDPACGL